MLTLVFLPYSLSYPGFQPVFWLPESYPLLASSERHMVSMTLSSQSHFPKGLT